MVSSQISATVAAVLVGVAVCCILRLYFLHLISTYPAFAFFLAVQVATTVFSFVAGAWSQLYAWAYLGLLIVEWLAYAWMIKELHNAIFSRYPGIAVLGRWSMYAAVAATVTVLIIGAASAGRHVAQSGTLVVAVEFSSHTLLFGFAATIAITLLVISKYPLEIHKNILVNCAVFSLILLGEAAELLADQFTLRHYTASLNLAMSVLGALCLAVWPFVLSRQEKVVKLRRDYTVDDEARLLGQLSAVNTLLLRSARK